jgi:protein-tyrosine phosphatase
VNVGVESFVDIHCHLLPGIDDGASNMDESFAMAKIAVADGIETIICTPHQCGNHAHNLGDDIRSAVVLVQEALNHAAIPLTVLAGADVRIEAGLVEQIARGEVLSLADLRQHVLLELPHELYIPLEPLLGRLKTSGMVGILSHPERNQGIIDRPQLVRPLVEAGGLMQITAGSLVGTFGEPIRKLSEQLLTGGLVHFIATDAHGAHSRRPLMQRAFLRAVELVGEQYALEICCQNPRAVAMGKVIRQGVRSASTRRLRGWFSGRKTA